MLRAREHAPTFSPSIVFTFGLKVESIKELGGVSNIDVVAKLLSFGIDDENML